MCAAAVAVALFAGCTSDGKSRVPEVTIPVETVAVATAAAATATVVPTTVVPTTVVPTTVVPTTATTVAPSAEDELRAATKAQWGDFRATLLNLETDDLSTMRNWYASPRLADSGLVLLKQDKAQNVTFRRNNPDVFEVRIESVTLLSADSATVETCLTDNLIAVKVVNGQDQVQDNSLASNRFKETWVRKSVRWLLESVERHSGAGTPCD